MKKECPNCKKEVQFNKIVWEAGNYIENCSNCGYKNIIGDDKFKEKYKENE